MTESDDSDPRCWDLPLNDILHDEFDFFRAPESLQTNQRDAASIAAVLTKIACLSCPQQDSA